MERTTQQDQAATPERLPEQPERPHTWTNTHPRENQELDLGDLERSIERLEAVLGR